MVGKGRFELPRLSAHDPKSCSSTNSDTSPSNSGHISKEDNLNDTHNQADITNVRRCGRLDLHSRSETARFNARRMLFSQVARLSEPNLLSLSPISKFVGHFAVS